MQAAVWLSEQVELYRMVIRSPPDQRRPGGWQHTQVRAGASRWTHGEPVDATGRWLRRGDKGANRLVKSTEAGGREWPGARHLIFREGAACVDCTRNVRGGTKETRQGEKLCSLEGPSWPF